MNDQRKVVYEQRRELMEAEDVADTVRDMRHQVIEDLVAKHIPEKAYRRAVGHRARCTADVPARLLALDLPLADWAKEEGIAEPGDPRADRSKASDELMAQQGRALRRAD